MRLLIAACCLVAWGDVACAEGKHANARGFGLTSCAEYGKAYQKNPDTTDNFFMTWAYGFISGVNAASDAVYLDLGAKTPDEMKRFLRHYCNDHPLANFGDAAVELAKSLPRIRKDDTLAAGNTWKGALVAAVRRCFNFPYDGKDADQFEADIDIQMRPDGTIAEEPVIVAVRGPSSSVGTAMAENAKRAIMKCQPYAFLPKQQYDTWKYIPMTFGMKDMQ